MSEWTRAFDSADLLPGESKVAWIGDTPVLVCNWNGDLYALEDRCSHEDFELSAGTFDARTGTVECVLHGARFDISNGAPLCAPAYTPVVNFQVRVEDGAIWILDDRD